MHPQTLATTCHSVDESHSQTSMPCACLEFSYSPFLPGKLLLITQVLACLLTQQTFEEHIMLKNSSQQWGYKDEERESSHPPGALSNGRTVKPGQD